MGLPILEEQPHQHQPPASPHDQEKIDVGKNLQGVKRKIGIHSGKGGVGKTFVSVNLALAATVSGLKTGLVDADVDCPNVARFFNLKDVPLRGTPEGRIEPLEYRGMKLVSTHFMSEDPEMPMIVRGPIKHKVLAEMLGKVDWGTLDLLLYDLPPGTADVPLSSMLIGNLDGIVIVTTPQKEAVMDARKSAIMAKDLEIPIVGVVENMSGDVFGEGAGKQLADELEVNFLGTIPLAKDIREHSEKGRAALVENDAYAQLLPGMLSGLMGEEVEVKQSLWRKMKSRW